MVKQHTMGTNLRKHCAIKIIVIGTTEWDEVQIPNSHKATVQKLLLLEKH